MYRLSQRSIDRLKGVDENLTKLVVLAISRSPVDFGIAYLGGFRTAEEQAELYKEGVTKCDGKIRISEHQRGRAVDLIPMSIGKAVQTKEMACIVAGTMFACASELGIKIRWGLDWNMNGDIRDNKFNDQAHFELV